MLGLRLKFRFSEERRRGSVDTLEYITTDMLPKIL